MNFTFRTVPGVQHRILDILSRKFEQENSRERDASLAFDEMSIKKMFTYSRANKQVYEPASKVMVVIVRGILAPWKQLIYFDFDQPMSKSLLFHLIVKCENSNIRIRAVTSDQGNPNNNIQSKQFYFIHSSLKK